MLDSSIIDKWNMNAQALLASCVHCGDSTAIDYCVEHGVNDDYFYNALHRGLWEAVVAINKTGEEVDEISVTTKLIHENWFDVCWLSEVLNTVETAAHIHAYVREVKECYRMNKIFRMTNELRENINSGVWDADDLIGHIQTTVQELDKAEADMLHARDFIRKGYESMTNPLESIGITTGFKDLDETIRGLRKKKFVVCAARPALGKSSLALNIADAATANCEEPVAIFSLEMPAEEIGTRFICSNARVAEDKIRDYPDNHDLKRKVYNAMENLSERNIYVDDSPDMTMSQITARARKLKNKLGGKLGMIVIDYLQLVTPEKTKESKTRAEKVGDISRACKKLSGILDTNVFCLAQIGRESEKDGRRPRMSDLRESGSIEQDADIILLLHQDEDMKESERVEGIVAKHRGGPTGIIDLRFKKYWTLFEPFTKQDVARQEEFIPDEKPKPKRRGNTTNVDVV
jgi:replicative DNA helicase